jgi:cyclophilin family peptidyl-prolyl cis-trans isomerase
MATRMMAATATTSRMFLRATTPATATQRASFGTGSRGSRGLGWYQKYREGRGGRHLQGKYWDRNVEELQDLNQTVFNFGSDGHYLDLKIGSDVHRLELELATAALPMTTQNFQLLSQDGFYQDTIVHRIEKKVGLCMGDVNKKEGKSGHCHASLGPHGKLPETEPLVLSHLAGVVTMVCPGVDKVDSRFILLSEDAPHLDGMFVGFGRLNEASLAIVKELESTHYTTRGLPNVEMKIVASGPLTPTTEEEQPPQLDEDKSVA